MFKPDLKSSVPIYEQIIAQIKEYILKGYLKPNDPLPSIRRLAIMSEVNPNTVAKAYSELERQHIIVTVRGKGTFVESDPVLEVRGDNSFKEKLRPITAEMLLAGMGEKEILDCVKEIIADLNTAKGE